MKSDKLLDSFIGYCHANPEQRFWQALRNWAKVSAIFVWQPKNTNTCLTDYLSPFQDMGLTDTFYDE